MGVVIGKRLQSSISVSRTSKPYVLASFRHRARLIVTPELPPHLCIVLPHSRGRLCALLFMSGTTGNRRNWIVAVMRIEQETMPGWRVLKTYRRTL